MRCMSYAELLQALQDRKGGGDWRRIAELSNVHYDTIARIARADIVPSVTLAERIAAAIATLPAATPEPAKA